MFVILNEQSEKSWPYHLNRMFVILNEQSSLPTRITSRSKGKSYPKLPSAFSASRYFSTIGLHWERPKIQNRFISMYNDNDKVY